jgi:hypothetical protein
MFLNGSRDQDFLFIKPSIPFTVIFKFDQICLPVQNSDFKRAAETSGSIIRFGAIVIHKHSVVAVISKDGTTWFSDFVRCF